MHICRIWSGKTKKDCLTPCRLQKRTGNRFQEFRGTHMMVMMLYSKMVTKFIAEPRKMSGLQLYPILHKIKKILHKMPDFLLLTCFYFVTNGQNFAEMQKKFSRSGNKENPWKYWISKGFCVVLQGVLNYLLDNSEPLFYAVFRLVCFYCVSNRHVCM